MEDGIPGRIHSYESFGTLDGPGVRFVVFLQGCPLRCRYCHNPDTWELRDGRSVTSGEVVKKIVSCRNFLSGGVTLSGGEPLAQPEFASDILLRCRAENLHTAIDTAGSYPLSHSASVIDLADMLLLDIKALDDALCRDLTGHSNRNTLATLDYCEEHGKPVWIRHVMVPGLTLNRDRLTALAAYLKPFKCIQRIDLLPFHKMAEYKWEQLHIRNTLLDTPEPTKEEIRMAEEIFFPEKFGKS